MSSPRRLAAALALLLATVPPVAAHHGPMPWDKSDPVSLTGMVVNEMDGFPHWEITIRLENGEEWTIDLGDDFTLDRIGLKPDGSDFPVGKVITVEGYHPIDPDWHRLQPTAIIVDGVRYDIRLHGEE